MAIKNLYQEYLILKKGQWQKVLSKALIVFQAKAEIKQRR